MTNFSELKKQNPLSFRLFEQWVEQNYETTLNIWNGTIRNEDIVEFLDEYWHVISVTGSISDRSYPFEVIWEWNGQIKTISGYTYTKPTASRAQATQDAIVKAFDMVETIIKRGNKLKQN